MLLSSRSNGGALGSAMLTGIKILHLGSPGPASPMHGPACLLCWPPPRKGLQIARASVIPDRVRLEIIASWISSRRPGKRRAARRDRCQKLAEDRAIFPTTNELQARRYLRRSRRTVLPCIASQGRFQWANVTMMLPYAKG